MASRMKSSGEIVPEKITKPIQLLAAWFLSLILIDSGFFTAARALQASPWISWFLVIAAVLNVYLFVYCIFQLQTKYRTQIQEDSYYSKYLGKVETFSPQVEQIKTLLIENQRLSLQREGDIQKQISELSRIVSVLNQDSVTENQPLVEKLQKDVAEVGLAIDFGRRWSRYRISLNDLLPNYAEITDFFESRGVKISDTFGSTSTEPDPPTLFVFSFGPGIDVMSLQELLRFLLEHGLKGIQGPAGNDPGLRELDDRRVYIGSYGYENSPVASVTPQLADELLKQNISLFQFTDIVRRNSVKPSVATP